MYKRRYREPKHEPTFAEKRAVLVKALRYLRKHKITKSIRSLQWDLVNLRKGREAKNSWRRIHQ